MDRQYIGVADKNRLFKMDGKLYREVANRQLISFLQSPHFEKLVERGWVPKHEARFDIDSGVFEVEQIPRLTYVFEWTALHALDAAALVCDINISLLESGSPFLLFDMHQYNVIFDAWRPVYVDVGSFEMISSADARHFQPSFNHNTDNLPRIESKTIPRLQNMLDLEAWKKIREWFHLAIERPEDVAKQSDTWDNYHKAPLPELFQDISPACEEQKRIIEWIKAIRPATAVDIGCNSGLYSRLLAREGIEVVGVDRAHLAVQRAFQNNKTLKLPITYAVLDVTSTDSRGDWQNKHFLDLPRFSWRDRCRSELVFSSSIGHHLALAGYDLKRQAQLYDELSEMYLIVEFIRPEDEAISNWQFNAPYSLEAFKNSLEKWHVLSHFDDPDRPTRSFFLFRK